MGKVPRVRAGASRQERAYLITYLKRAGYPVHANTSNKTLKSCILSFDKAFGDANEHHPPKRFVREYAILLASRRKLQGDRPKIVYIIGNRDKGLCKIGVSVDPEKRCQQLQTACPFPISILAEFKGKGHTFERQLHNRAAEYHEQGEWFRIEGRLAAYLSGK